MEELLNQFNELLGQYSRHREYIRRAKDQATKFSSSIIEKVVLDHEIKSSSIADELLPLIPGLQEQIAGLEQQKSGIEEGRSRSDEVLQELQLRHLIGEMTDEEFAQETSGLSQNLEESAGRVAALEAERVLLQGALDRWVELAQEAGQSDGIRPTSGVSGSATANAGSASPAVPAAGSNGVSLVKENDDVFHGSDLHGSDLHGSDLHGSDLRDGASADAGWSPSLAGGSAPSNVVEFQPAAEPEGLHASYGGREDLSAVFASDSGAGASAAIAEPEIDVMDPEAEEDGAAIATMEVEEDGEEPGDLPFSFDTGPEEVEGDPVAGGRVEIDALEGEDDVSNIAIDIGEVADFGEDGFDNGGAGEEPRRALLLYQEGTTEEQIYPFTGDVLTIGRGRDNDIQIKNDSKVSRFHCKLFRRAANFYIEDNKSSNGTLVNGELITERRLFGGEEVIIGETFFRFRIM